MDQFICVRSDVVQRVRPDGVWEAQADVGLARSGHSGRTGERPEYMDDRSDLVDKRLLTKLMQLAGSSSGPHTQAAGTTGTVIFFFDTKGAAERAVSRMKREYPECAQYPGESKKVERPSNVVGRWLLSVSEMVEGVVEGDDPSKVVDAAIGKEIRG